MSELGGTFGALDWAVLIGVTLAVTWLGHLLAGRATDERSFFLGNKNLPWWAVSASIIATEISAVTFIAFPSAVWKEGGDLTYLQIVFIGSGIARLVIGFVLVPAYFEREIYSPYEYMGSWLGARARGVATALFSLGGVLGQAARVYLIAIVLGVLLHRELGWVEATIGVSPLVASIVAIAIVATLWTWAGGIRTVIWTDALLFALFLSGIILVLLHAHLGLEGGLDGALVDAHRAGKLRVLSFERTLAKPFTFWAALIAASWGSIGFYGTDQLLAQRLFCCRDAQSARWAIVTSLAAGLVILAVGLVGAALWAWTEAEPLTGAALEFVRDKPDRIFPLYILTELPAGLRGLVVAGAFAAAISSLDSILAALAQTSLTNVVRPLRQRLGRGETEGDFLATTRWLILGWAVVLASVAVLMDPIEERYKSLLNLALAMASYTGGALIAGFFLSFWRIERAGSGFSWSAPLSVLAVVAVAWPAPVYGSTPVTALGVAAGVAGFLWLGTRVRQRGLASEWRSTGALALAIASLFALANWAVVPLGDELRPLAWPWYVPLGSTFAFVFAICLRSRCESSALSSPAS